MTIMPEPRLNKFNRSCVLVCAPAAEATICSSTNGSCYIVHTVPRSSSYHPTLLFVYEQHRFLAKVLELLPGTWSEDEWIWQLFEAEGHHADYVETEVARLRSARRFLEEIAARPNWSCSARTAVAAPAAPVLSGKHADFLDLIMEDQRLRQEAFAAVDYSETPHVDFELRGLAVARSLLGGPSSGFDGISGIDTAKLGNDTIFEYQVWVLDEVSMLLKTLFKHVIRMWLAAKQAPVLIFVDDFQQLAPVANGQEDSRDSYFWRASPPAIENCFGSSA